MKVLVDGYWWREGPRSNRMVLLEIVQQWLHDYPEDDVLLAVPAARKGRRGPDLPVGVEMVRTHLRRHPAINAIELPIIARRHSVDAILAFNFAAISDRGAVFLHDVLFQSNPEWFTLVERAYFSAMPALARRARCVIATSRSERSRIETRNPRLRRVVNCGLSTSSSLAGAIPEHPGLGLVRGGFLLCVGRLNVRKNLEGTMRALQRSGLLSESLPLVVIGEPSGRVADISQFTEAISGGRIVLADCVTDSQLKWLYSNCKLFVCLSLDEGFGLPVVEASNCGASILASDIPVFRETLGSYATFVDPSDMNAIADCTRRIVASKSQPTDPYVEEHSWRTICKGIRQELQLLAPTRQL